MIKPSWKLPFILLMATLILLTPLIAMQFTNEVDWDWFDFLVMAILLYGFGMLIEFSLRKFKNTCTRIILVLGLLLALFLIWAEIAVGIFGTPFAGS
jgi:predicted Na+-dependent transporter